MDTTRQKNLENDIPSSYLDKFNNISKESWKHEDFRKRVIQICSEHENSNQFTDKVRGAFNTLLQHETFINKVKSIVKKEIEQNKLQTTVKIILWALGGFGLAIIGGLVQKFFKVF